MRPLRDSRIERAQTVLAETSAFTMPPNGSLNGEICVYLQTRRYVVPQAHKRCVASQAYICMPGDACKSTPFSLTEESITSEGVFREDCLSECCIRVSSAAAELIVNDEGTRSVSPCLYRSGGANFFGYSSLHEQRQICRSKFEHAQHGPKGKLQGCNL